MIAILILAGLGFGSLVFLLWFLHALVRQPKGAVNSSGRAADRSLAVVLMDRYLRDKRAA